MHRVELLADRPAGGRPARVHPFHSLVPLPEVLGQLYNVGAGSKQVTHEYEKLLSRLGPELRILLQTPLEEIATVGGDGWPRASSTCAAAKWWRRAATMASMA